MGVGFKVLVWSCAPGPGTALPRAALPRAALPRAALPLDRTSLGPLKISLTSDVDAKEHTPKQTGERAKATPTLREMA